MVAILTIQWMTILTMAVLCSPGDLAAARHLRHHNVDDAGAAPHADQHLARTTGAHAALTLTLTLPLTLALTLTLDQVRMVLEMASDVLKWLCLLLVFLLAFAASFYRCCTYYTHYTYHSPTHHGPTHYGRHLS